ncbi:MAG: hypothetical protein AB1430_07325 [Pseudomonadota bacterium]
MDATLLWPALALVVGATGATLICRWHFARVTTQLHKRLAQAEQARHTERDRGHQMRSQIAQLTKLVTELQHRQRRAHHDTAVSNAPLEQRRAELDKKVPDQMPQDRPVLPSNGFADTLPM